VRTSLAVLCGLPLLAGCGRHADRDTAADTRSDPNGTHAAASTGVPRDTANHDSLEWRPAPGLPDGARVAVLAGDPSKPGPYTIRLEVPAGYRVPPHHHPAAEHVKVLEGSVRFGHGRQWSEQGMKSLAVGQEATVPALQPHFVEAPEHTIIEASATGPYVIVYENTADDPRKAPIQ
jgi:quercetin dioxygenase-like cupin family protein